MALSTFSDPDSSWLAGWKWHQIETQLKLAHGVRRYWPVFVSFLVSDTGKVSDCNKQSLRSFSTLHYASSLILWLKIHQSTWKYLLALCYFSIISVIISSEEILVMKNLLKNALSSLGKCSKMNSFCNSKDRHSCGVGEGAWVVFLG